MKFKRIILLFLVLVMMMSMIPLGYAADKDAPSPAAEESEGFTEIGSAPYEYARQTSTGALRNCDQMNMRLNGSVAQGFHFYDEDGVAPWDYTNMLYCLEQYKDFSHGLGNTGSTDLPFDGTGETHGENVWYSLSADQRFAIGLILMYGAPTKIWDDNWGFNAEGDWNMHNPNIGYRFATQALVWEITGGGRDPVPPYTRNRSYWYDLAVGMCTSEDGSIDYFKQAYDQIVSDLQRHNTIPSFTGDFAATAPEILLTANSITLTDTNNVLSRFTFQDTEGVSYAKSGNKLTLSVTGAVPTSVQRATALLPDPEAALYEVWSNEHDWSKQVCIRITVPGSDPVPAYFKLKASTGTLALKKTTEDGENLSGWKFSLYSDEACTQLLSGPHTTDTGGNVQVEGLMPGDVWVKEEGHVDVEINAQYECSSNNPQKVTISPNQTSSVSFHNKLSKGTARIVKLATNGGFVGGWHFNVTRSNGSVVGNYITDASGIIELVLEPGTYTVTETYGPMEYWINDSQPTRTVTVKPGETSYVTFTNQWVGKAEIIKTATNGGSVAGWHFTVTKSDGTEVGKYVTDASGVISLNLDPGTYTVTETDEEKAYWKNDSKPSKTVAVKAGQTAKVSFENQWFGKAEIIKSTTNGGRLDGWTFTVADVSGNVVGTYTTSATGKIVADLEPGVYTVTESKTDDPYWHCDEGPKTITVKAGQTASVSFENRWIGKAKIVKALEKPHQGTVEGWTFNISKIDENGNAQSITTATTDKDGIILLDLDPGEYLITEVLEENSLWDSVGGKSKRFNVEAGKTAEVSFVNFMRIGKINIHKVNTQGEALKGVEFLLECSKDGSNWAPVSSAEPCYCTSAGLNNGKLLTGKDGLAVFEGLNPTLHYRLSETKTLEGYELLKDIAFEGKLPIDEDLTVGLTVVNAQTFNLPRTGRNGFDLVPAAIIIGFLALGGAFFVLRKRETA